MAANPPTINQARQVNIPDVAGKKASQFDRREKKG